MAKAREHDPLALLRFAIRESDWILADLIACLLVLDEGSRERLCAELAEASRRPGAPDSLERLHRLASLSRSLDRVADPD